LPVITYRPGSRTSPRLTNPLGSASGLTSTDVDYKISHMGILREILQIFYIFPIILVLQHFYSRSLSLAKSYTVSFKHISRDSSPPYKCLDPSRASISSLRVRIRYSRAYIDLPPASRNNFTSSLLPPQEYRIR
jgi:hypothetical protein